MKPALNEAEKHILAILGLENCSGQHISEPNQPKPTGHQPRDALAPLTRRSKPNQTNQTHTING